MTGRSWPGQAGGSRPWKKAFALALSLAFLFAPPTGKWHSLAESVGSPHQTDSSWTIETVDGPGDGAKWTALVLDGAGYPHIAYYLDGGNYAYQDAAGWHIAPFDDNGYDLSIALGSDGYPRIAYRNLNRMDYAYQDSSGWHSVFVHGYLSTESYCSLALDSDGYAHFSFYDELRILNERVAGDLWYSYQDAAGWHKEMVPDGVLGFRGKYTSIAVDEDGYPHISYYHESRRDLKYAYRDSSGWHVETVDSEDYVGSHTSLALDDSGYPHISYFFCGGYGCTARDLKYAYQDASGWHIETVDSERDVGTYTSLGLDSSGYPHISYRDYSSDDLKYAYQDASGWHVETVDSEGDVGEYTHLAVGEYGAVHISYIDAGNHSLKYAYLAGQPPELSPVYLPVIMGR